MSKVKIIRYGIIYDGRIMGFSGSVAIGSDNVSSYLLRFGFSSIESAYEFCKMYEMTSVEIKSFVI